MYKFERDSDHLLECNKMVIKMYGYLADAKHSVKYKSDKLNQLKVDVHRELTPSFEVMEHYGGSGSQLMFKHHLERVKRLNTRIRDTLFALRDASMGREGLHDTIKIEGTKSLKLFNAARSTQGEQADMLRTLERVEISCRKMNPKKITGNPNIEKSLCRRVFSPLRAMEYNKGIDNQELSFLCHRNLERNTLFSVDRLGNQKVLMPPPDPKPFLQFLCVFFALINTDNFDKALSYKPSSSHF